MVKLMNLLFTLHRVELMGHYFENGVMLDANCFIEKWAEGHYDG